MILYSSNPQKNFDTSRFDIGTFVIKLELCDTRVFINEERTKAERLTFEPQKKFTMGVFVGQKLRRRGRIRKK